MSTKTLPNRETDFFDDPCLDIFNVDHIDEDDYSTQYGRGQYQYLGSMCGPADKRGIARSNHARRIPRAKRLDELDEEI